MAFEDEKMLKFYRLRYLRVTNPSNRKKAFKVSNIPVQCDTRKKFLHHQANALIAQNHALK